MIRKYIIEADDSIKEFDEEIAKLEREWGTEEIEPCEDCISRKEASHFLCERIERFNKYELYDIFSRIIDDMYNELPSVTPSRPKGKWIIIHPLQEDDDGAYICSNCGHGDCDCDTSYKYCPFCGVEMNEVEAKGKEC